MSKDTTVNSWLVIIAVMLTLFGVYGIARVGINLAVFAKYPTDGIYTLNFSGIPQFPQREEDCLYPQTYVGIDGDLKREPTRQEKEQEKFQQESCLSLIYEARSKTQVNDISKSLVFLFLGLGILAGKKFFLKYL